MLPKAGKMAWPMGWFFCGHSWVAGGWHRLKNRIYFSTKLFFFSNVFSWIFFPRASPGPLASLVIKYKEKYIK